METSVDKHYFIGSVSKSLERLPQWYQIGALCGVLIIIYLHDTFVISWLVMNLHNSLGTSWIWYPEYQDVLKQISFKERLCFTIYGISLGIIVVLLYKVFCQEGFKIGSSLSQLFPDRKGLTVLVCVSLCLVEMIRIHEVITECFTKKDSIASIALKKLGEGGHGNSRSKHSLHIVIQVELLKAFLLHVLPQHVMVTLVAMAFRLIRDIPRDIYVSLRWCMVTIALVYSIRNIFCILLFHSKPTLSSLATLGWSAILLGAVNYLYGPSKRAGMVATISTSCTLTKTIRGLLMCMALWNMISLLALALVVSVHVVELISIWFMTTLLILWIPAIVDSCSLEGIIFITGLLSALLYFMGQLSSTASLRLGLMVALGWLNTSLSYNLIANVFHTRYAGLCVIVWLLLWAIHPHKKVKDPWKEDTCQSLAILNIAEVEPLAQSKTAKAVSVVMPMVDGNIYRKMQWLCDVAELRAPLERQTVLISRFSGGNEGSETFYYVIFTNLGLSITLLALLTLLGMYQSPAVQSSLRQANLILVTVEIFIRKIAWAIVITLCVFIFLAEWWTLHQYILPYITPILPGVVSHVISGVFGCITFGALMDMKDTMYEAILQVLGLMDPQECIEENNS